MAQVDVWWRLWVLAVRLDKAGLQVNDVFSERVVFRLDGLVVFFELVQGADLLFELFDVAFFALAEGALLGDGRLVGLM